MVQRTRDLRLTAGAGHQYDGTGAWLADCDNLSRFDRCIDNKLPGNGHNLDIGHITCEGGLLNVQTGSSPIHRIFVNWQLDRLRNPLDAAYNHLTVPGGPSYDMLVSDLLSKTNPSRPVVDLPIAIYELREIPKLLKLEGDTFLKLAGSANLSYQFGIKPLVNDLLNLLNFSDEVAKRQKELDALADSGLRRKRQLWSGSTAGSQSQFLQSLGYNVGNCSCSKTTHVKHWGFVEWSPIDKLALMKADRRALAKKAVLGLTVDFSTAWNAIPWSWLIDWCSNAGDILISRRNLVGAEHGPILIMSTIYTTGRWRAPAHPVTDALITVTTKLRRSFAGASLSVQLPILSWRQLSILASIGVTRRMPRNI